MQSSGIIIAGKYELGKEIGKGGMSRVYLATDTRLNKVWAVKKVDKTSTNQNKDLFIKNLRKEVELMEGLSYATIPRIVDIIEDTQTIYIVMDYVEGEGLDKILKIQGKQNEDDVIEWAKQLCETLVYLHNLKKPVIHRDIKPANIVLQPGVQNAIKILDFGIAEEITKENSRNLQPVGTPGYMAPEQETKGAPYDIRSDIYSFGATIHHLLTGKIPKKGKGFVKLRAVTGRVSENTEGLEYVIEKCLKKDPNERYQNCNELLYDLNHLQDLSKEHRQKLVSRVITFSVCAGLSLVFAISSVFANIGYNNIARSNQSTYANEIYELSNEILSIYSEDKNNFEEIYTDMRAIEDSMERSNRLSNNSYSNALVFTVYSFSMWNLNEAIQFSLPASPKLDEENKDAYENCKEIFSTFIKSTVTFSNNISNVSDSKKVAICVSELNAFNVLFDSSNENAASGILKTSNDYMRESGMENLMLEDCFSKDFNDYIKSKEGSAFYQNEILNQGIGNDLISVLNDYALARTAANDSLNAKKMTEQTKDEKKEALENCLSQYSTVINAVSNTNLNHYYKFLLISNAANYLDHNIDKFKKNNVEESYLTNDESLYRTLNNAVDDLKDESTDSDFKEKCENLNIKGIERDIKSEYHPTSSKNV